MKNQQRDHQGFTLVELLIAVSLLGMVGVGTTMLISTIVKSYTLEDQIQSMTETGQYAFKQVTEAIMSAGAGLPITPKFTVITTDTVTADSSRHFWLRVNARGGAREFPEVDSTSGVKRSLPVDDADLFSDADSVVVASVTDTITPNYYKLDSVNVLLDSIFLHAGSTVNFSPGMVLYPYKRLYYHLNGMSLCVNKGAGDDTLADFIDTLRVSFSRRDSTGPLPARVWKDMDYAFVKVTARTPSTKPDILRRLSFDMSFKLKNKF